MQRLVEVNSLHPLYVVHLGGGLWGVLAQPLFSYGVGVFYKFVCIVA